MAVGAATVTHSGSDDEEVRQKPLGPEVMALSLSEAFVEASVRCAPLQSELSCGSSTVISESTGRPWVTHAEGVTRPE